MERERGIRVMIVDDHRMVADALRAALSAADGIDVVAVAHDHDMAIERAREHRPDVAVVDFALQGADGLEVAKDLRLQLPELRILLMTGGGSEILVARARDTGCDGFLHKSEPVARMIATVREIASGNQSFPKAKLERANELLRDRQRRAADTLTVRERQVLQLLADGLSTDEIVNTLIVSPHTVRSHVRHILEKLGAHSKLQAVTIAAREGLVTVGDDDTS